MTTLAPPPSSAAKAKLVRRAQVIARLRHPNLVRMLPLPGGAGLVPVETGDRRLADFTLPAGTFKRFDLEQVVRLMLDVLSGLSALHAAPVEDEPFVHGQVCPQHVYVGERGTSKLIPLTTAHLLTPGRVEQSGYVAPELLLGEPFDVRADVFSVGVMLWEAVAGQRLFPDPRPEAVVRVLAELERSRLIPSPRAAWAAPLCAIVERAIASEPAKRHASASEFGDAISQAVGPQLLKVGAETWQDEAPTPVLQPRLHFLPLRSTVPPATVVDVRSEGSEVAPLDAIPRDDAPAPAEPTASLAVAPRATRSRRARALDWGLGSLMFAALGFSLQHRTVTSVGVADPPRAGAALGLADAPFAAMSAATVVPSSAAPTAPPAAASISSAPAAAGLPRADPTARPPRPRAASKKLPSRPAPADADYGI